MHLTSSWSIQQALHHPAIVSLLSTFSTEDAQYHVMELCSRGTLSAFLSSRNNPVLSENELRGVIKSLVDALIYLRKELVLHRDIKAANILLMDDFRVVSYIFCVDIVPNGVFVRNCRILALQPVCFRKSQPYRHTVGLRTMPRRTYYLY